SVFIWGGGSLSQNGWQSVMWLLPQLALGVLGAGLLARPLTLLAMDDSGASQLGLSLFRARLLALAIAVALSAAVVSAVGVIGFIGLAAPAIARFAGARRLRDRLLWAPLTGAALLLLTDQLVQCLPGVLGRMIPTGAAVALCGGPLLLWLLRHMPAGGQRQISHHRLPPRRRLSVTLAVLLCLLVAAGVASLHFADSLQGWQWTTGTTWWRLLPWRAPGMVEALAAGAMLALAGTLLQRVSGNPLASPELLGVSGGAMLGIATTILLLHASGPIALLTASAIGALISLLAVLAIARRKQFAPGHV